MTEGVIITGLTVVPSESFKVAIKAIIETGTIDEVFSALENAGITEIYLSQSVMEITQSFFTEMKQKNLIGDGNVNVEKVIQCATCCNGCRIGRDI